ncbi:MAG: NAD(P)/FAD-dependent oxidoreductase [Pseudomonadota bacterium]
MTIEKTGTVIVGGGQAGLAMSAHLKDHAEPHLILERDRIAERWRTARWDSLVANGPAWHDRFPAKEFADVDPDGFASKESVANYLEDFAKEIDAPVRCGVEVLNVSPLDGGGFRVETSDGVIDANNVVAATGPFQHPVFPPIVPETAGIKQMHSFHYHNPEQLADGAVLVVGAGSSGTQIAEELMLLGRDTWLSVGPHDRPPRSYRGKDFVWWLGVLGKWELKSPPAGAEHVTIAVSGARGGETVDFRRLGSQGMNLLGMTQDFKDGVLRIAGDLQENVAKGDANYLALLDEADEYIEREGLGFPLEPDARTFLADPPSLANPTLELDLAKANIKTIIWATGYVQEFRWLNVDVFDESGRPQHQAGITDVPGIYFLGLPWLSMRGSSFIWGVWVDAMNLANHISQRRI